MNILMLGVKEYPYGSSYGYDKYPGGGTAREVIDLCHSLSTKGCEIHLIVRKMFGQKKRENTNNVNIYRVPWVGNRYLRLPLFNLVAFLKAFSIMKDIDIIHTHGSFAVLYGLILGRLFGKKVIATPHGLGSYQSRNNFSKLAVKLLMFNEKIGYSNVDKVIFVSHDEKNTLVNELGADIKNYSIINIGIKPLIMNNNRDDNFNIVFIGRLVKFKGVDKLIKSYNYLPHQIKQNSQYIIVGDGNYRKELERVADENKLNGAVKFVGYSNNVADYLKIASLLILPSDGGEGLPSSILEAMSVGVVCMVSNFNPPMNKDSIIILKDNNPVTIAREIKNLYTNKELYERYSQNAIKEIYENFDIDKVADNYINAYKEVVNNSDDKKVELLKEEN